MNWRKDWRKVFCTLLIVTAEAHRVYDATHPRTRKQEPRAAGGDESSLEPLRIDEPRGGDDGLRELLTPPMPIYDNIESELLREQLLATSAESPAEAFVKRLLNPSPASRSKFEELLREQLAASESRAAAAEASLAESTTQAKESALENEDLREQLAAAESRAVEAEASLPSFKESAANDAAPQSEVEALREQLAAAEAAVAALHASSSFELPTAKGAVQHLRLEGEIDAASKVNAKGVAHRRRLSLVSIFGRSYDPATTTVLRAPPASPDARRGARPPLGVAGTSRKSRSPARSRPRSACSRR